VIGRRTLLILANNFVGAFFGFFALRYLARFPPQSLGAYTWAFSAVGVAMLLATLGFHSAHVKRVSEGIDERIANGTYFMIKLVLTSAFLAIVLGGLLVYRIVLGRTITDATTEPVLVIVTGAYALLSLRQFFDATFQAHRHTARAESVLFIDTVVSVGGVALAWNIWSRSNGGWTPNDRFFDGLLDVLGVTGGLSRADGGLLIGLAYLLGRGASLLFAAGTFFLHKYPLGRFSWEVFHSYKYLGLPLAFVAGLTVFYANVDRLFLGYFWDEVAVANFHIPYTILTPMLFVATAIGTLLFPTISQLDATGNLGEMRTQIRRSERYLSMVLLPQMVLAFVFAREGINIFNAQYLGEALTLRILIAYVFFSVLVAPARSLLLGTGNPRYLLHLGIINVIVVVGLNLILVPPQMLGMREEGAAIVAGIGAFVGYVYTKVRAAQWIGKEFIPPGLIRQMVAAVALGGILWSARLTFGAGVFTRFWQLMIVGVASVPIYLVLLVLLREFRRADWDFLMDLLHPGKFAGYVSGELAGRQKKP
jgi:O-antigen/teichoic acid export membrane protein